MKSSSSAWGDQATQTFFKLTPDRVLQAVEQSGYDCTGRCQALGSYENRVYDVELDLETGSLNERSRVVKFYRPGRWSEAQILEEHEFLLELQKEEVPVVAPLTFPDGKTLHQETGSKIFYALFPKVGGRSPDELDAPKLERIGRLLARIHTVGARHPAKHRISLTEKTYGEEPLAHLLSVKEIPLELESRYTDAARKVIEVAKNQFDLKKNQRVHGDCHLGNLLWNQEGPFFLDFDDFVMGPPVQDIWLLVQGNDAETRQKREILIQAYEQLRDFDRSSLNWIEPLRALRLIHFDAWVSKRWEDPAFPYAFPQFKSHRFWEEQVNELESIVNALFARPFS